MAVNDGIVTAGV